MKLTIRKAMLSQTRSKTAEELRQYSEKVCEAIEKNEKFQKAQTILAFWSLPDEVNTHELIQKWTGKKTFLLPKVVGDMLELRLRFFTYEKVYRSVQKHRYIYV